MLFLDKKEKQELVKDRMLIRNEYRKQRCSRFFFVRRELKRNITDGMARLVGYYSKKKINIKQIIAKRG